MTADLTPVPEPDRLGIVVGFDGRDGGRDAIALGRQIAGAGSLTVAVVAPFSELPIVVSRAEADR